MKASTLTTMALLSASCFAAPIHTTALDSLTARAALAAARADSAPVAPPAPGIEADTNVTRAHWARIKLPKPYGLASHFAPHERQAQT
ncbi:MAG: hypothetical protein QOI13_699 [Paraburkholderia sp.]|nr:hypothetical protein [Paraburkholderia sp.]